MNAPDRILAWAWEVNPRMGQWSDEQQIVGEGAEYIRRDPAVLAALPEVQALIEASYENGLSDALGIVASIGYGATEDVDRGHEDAYRAIEKHLADWKASAAAMRAIAEGRE